MIEFTRWLILPAAGIVALMAVACGSARPQPQEREVPAGDVTLHVRIAGDPAAGEVLVGISGGPGLSSDYMASLEKLAGPELIVVTYDPRGTGHSTTPAYDAANYDLSRYAGDLEAVRKAVGADKVHLLGHSWGGVVAMYYATVFPEHVDAIVLMGSGPPNIEGLRLAQRHFQERIVELTRQGLIPENLSSVGAAQVRAILPAYFSDPSFEPPAELLDMTFSQTVSDLTLSALGQYDMTGEVARLDQRVLILFGEDDPFNLSMAEATRDALSAAEVEFVVLEQCGHFWQECPERFFEAVRSFLELSSGADNNQ
jgi:proline iminopeptidase